MGAGVNARKILGAVAGKNAVPCTLSKRTQLGRIAGEATRGTQVTFDDYSCKGYIRSYKRSEIDGDRITGDDRLIGIYAETLRDDGGNLIEPVDGDQVTIAEDGLPPQTYSIAGTPYRGSGGAHYIVNGRR